MRIHHLLKRIPILGIGMGWALWGLTACEDSEKFTSAPDAALVFTTDTLSFDTVITTVGSSTQRLKIYNKNKKGVRLDRVWLEAGSQTHYRVNVDGVFLSPSAGASVSGLEIRGGDSLIVFAEVTLPEKHQDQPYEVLDKLKFQLESGRVQQVVMRAVGQDAYMWRGRTFKQDTTLTAGRPFIIYDSLTVAEGVTLTLQPGVQLYFHDKADLLLRGRMEVNGTLQQPVVFRGDRTDRLFDYLPYDNTPSRWGGIRLFATSRDNRWNYADIHSATYGVRCDSAAADYPKLTLLNSILHNIGGDGLSAVGCSIRVANTQISNTKGDLVRLVGGKSSFVHCTLAQFYPWEALRGQALYMADHSGEAAVPIQQIHFRNCLITGYADDVLLGSLNEKEQDYDYLFDHCLLNTAAVQDDKHYRAVVFEPDQEEDHCIRDKGFRVFDTENYWYDFAPDSCSAALGIGDPQVTAAYPFDRNGIRRDPEKAPAAGCYEMRPKKKP